MPKVIYRGQHLPDEIDGVKYQKHPSDDGAIVSAEISEEAAARLATIPGFELVGAKKAAKAPEQKVPEDDDSNKQAELSAKEKADAAKAEAAEAKAALLERAAAAGVTVKSNWGAERLRTEVEQAEAAAAEAAQKGPAADPDGKGAEGAAGAGTEGTETK